MNELGSKLKTLGFELESAQRTLDSILYKIKELSKLYQPTNKELLSNIAFYISTKTTEIIEGGPQDVSLRGQRVYFGPYGNILEITINDGVYLSNKQMELVKEYYSDNPEINGVIFRN